MATIEPYELAPKTGKDGQPLKPVTKYRVRYRRPDGKQTDKRGFLTKRDANLFLNKVEVSKAQGEYIAPKLGRATIGELAPNWLQRKEQATAPSNYRTLETAWRVHVQATWKAQQVANITTSEIEKWITKLAKDKSATVVLRAHGVLAGIIDDATKDGRIKANPARSVDNLPRKTSRRHIYLSGEDVTRLAEESGPHSTLIYILAFCGLRWGEAIALRRRDIDFIRRRLQVHENAVEQGTEIIVGTTKGKESRSVPIPGFVLDMVAETVQNIGRDGLVFPGADGDYLRRPKSVRGWFGNAVARANIQSITPHDLRHTCASLAISSGASVLVVSRMLGHKDPSVTLKIYADLFDADLDAVADALHSAHGQKNDCGQNVGTLPENHAN